MRPGVVSVPHGFGHGRDGVGWRRAAAHSGASVNDITDPMIVDRLTGNAAFNDVPVCVQAAEVSREEPQLEAAGTAAARSQPLTQHLQQQLGRLRAGHPELAIDDERRDPGTDRVRSRSARPRAPRRRSGHEAIRRLQLVGGQCELGPELAQRVGIGDQPPLGEVGVEQAFLHLGLQPMLGGEMDEPVPVEGVAAARAIEMEIPVPRRRPSRSAAFGQTAPARSASRTCERGGRPARPRARVAPCGSSSKLRQVMESSSSVLELGQCALQAALADVAPRAGDVGPDLEFHCLQGSQAGCWIRARGRRRGPRGGGAGSADRCRTAAASIVEAVTCAE